MDEVTARASCSCKKNGVTVRNKEPGKTMETNEVNGEARGVTNKVTRGGEREAETSVSGKANT
jgi:hypothetical protein